MPTFIRLGDHHIVYIDTDITAKINKPIKRKIHIWKKANIEEQVEKAKNMAAKFKEVLNLDNPVNGMWIFIKSNLLNILAETVPSKMTSSIFNQPWINQNIKQIKRQKKISFVKARKTKKKADIARYHHLKNLSQKECRKAYRDYISDIINPELSTNPKRFWSFIKSKKCESVGVAPLKVSDGLT